MRPVKTRQVTTAQSLRQCSVDTTVMIKIEIFDSSRIFVSKLNAKRMKATNNSLINNYFMLLKSLSPNDKLELITKLSQSIKSKLKEKNSDKTWRSLFGALELEIPVDDFLTDLKKDRNFRDKSLGL
jgi:hypothetical protein